MRIVLSTPSTKVRRTGNRCTAGQWAHVLEQLGHEVRILEIGDSELEVDSAFLIALHGERSAPVIRSFRAAQPDGKIVVALTGTDLYPEPNEIVRESIRLADGLVLLQDKALERLPESDRHKARVIVQGASPCLEPVEKSPESFDVCVVGHLREVKDPLRAASASRLLPEDSRIRILHAGGILEDRYEDLVEKERRENPRYRWLGELDEREVSRLIASSHLMVMSSFAEGGARVVGEAAVNGTPVLSSFIEGVRGLLGDDYPGYFKPGDTSELASLLGKAETDPDFLGSLQSAIDTAAPRFHPEREKEGWRKLIDELTQRGQHS